MESYLLNKTDLNLLTGYKQAARQKSWLTQKSIPWTEDKGGQPVVRATDVNAHFERQERRCA